MLQQRVHDDAVLAVAWPVNNTILTGAIPGQLCGWTLEAKSGKPSNFLKKFGPSPVHALGVSAIVHDASGDRFVTSGLYDGTLLLHSNDGKVIATHAPSGIQETQCLAYSLSRSAVAAGTRRGTIRMLAINENMDEGSLTFVEETDISCSVSSSAPAALVTGIAFAPSGQMTCQCHLDGNVSIVDVEAKGVIATVVASPSSLRAVAWSTDGRYIYSAGDDHRVLVFDASGLTLADGAGSGAGASSGSGSVVPLPLVCAMSGHTGFICCAAAAPDRPLVATGGNDRCIRVWDPKKRECVATVDGLVGMVTSIVWSPDGKHICAGTEAGTVVVWTPQC